LKLKSPEKLDFFFLKHKPKVVEKAIVGYFYIQKKANNMSTKAPSGVKRFSETSVEKKVYNLVESLKEFMPINNDRNRLGYGLVKYLSGDGDAPEILVKSAKINISGIEYSELAKKLSEGLKTIK